MHKFLYLFLCIGAISFSQTHIIQPDWFKGDHFVIYNKCKTAVLFCESTQQDYTFCGASKNCQGLYVSPGDTFFLNYEDKLQSKNIVADISFQNYLPGISSHTFLPVADCIPPQPLQINIPMNAVSGSSFQITAQNPAYVPAEPFQPWIPLPIYVYVGDQQPANTSALAGFTNCPVTEAVDTTSAVYVKEFAEQNQFTIYPNPSEGIVTITCATTNTRDLTMRLTNILGKEILNSPYKEELDISYLEKGIYFLSLYQNGSLLSTKKVVKE